MFNWVNDGLSFNDFNNADAPESLIWFSLKEHSFVSHELKQYILPSMSSDWKDELILIASDNNDASDEPIFMSLEWNSFEGCVQITQKSFRINSVIVELTFNASDRNDTPDSPILIQ